MFLEVLIPIARILAWKAFKSPVLLQMRLLRTPEKEALTPTMPFLRSYFPFFRANSNLFIGELVTTPKTPMKAYSRRLAGFGVRIVVWFRYSLNKQQMGMKCAPIENLTRRKNYRLRSHDWLLGFEVLKRKKRYCLRRHGLFFQQKKTYRCYYGKY